MLKNGIIRFSCLVNAVMMLGYLTYWPIGTWELRVTFFTLGLIAAVLYYSEGRKSDEVAVPTQETEVEKRPGKCAIPPVEALLILLAVVIWVYTITGGVQLIQRAGTFPTTADVIIGTICTILCIELGRRTTGWIIPSVALILIAYGLFGPYFPGMFYHRGISYSRLISNLYSPTGIFGELLGIAVTYVFVYVTLGAFLEVSKAGEFLIKFADALVGKRIGGPAKCSVVSSSLFGTISGSTVANVMVDGWYTIPIMKKSGFDSHRAAAVEAVASTGGQIMPPVMGAAAFVMAENLGIPYNKLALAGFIPAFMYYGSLFMQIHLYCLNRDIKGTNSGTKLMELIRTRGFLLAPLVVLIVLLFVVQMTPVRAGLWGIASVIVFSWFDKETRMGPRRIISSLINGVQALLVMVGICAVAGIVIQLLDVTGMGLLLTNALLSLASGNFWLTAVLIALITLILGMGMPTVPAYILAAVVGVPALMQLKVDPFVAHFFVFYYACMSSITPPVALGAFAAASIAQSDPWKTGWAAFRLGIVGVLVPFALICQPALLLIGTVPEIIYSLFFSAAGIAAMAYATEGHHRMKLGWGLRVLLFISGLILFIAMPLYLNLIAFAVASACIAGGILLYRQQKDFTSGSLGKGEGAAP